MEEKNLLVIDETNLSNINGGEVIMPAGVYVGTYITGLAVSFALGVYNGYKAAGRK